MTDKKKLSPGSASAMSSIFWQMGSPDGGEQLHQQIVAWPDELIDLAAQQAGIPPEQYALHRAMVRGQPNEFMEGLKQVDGLLKTGDVILMTGNSPSSKLLVQAQRVAYGDHARASHAALVHADLVCIDAMPKVGATNRIVSELLADAEDNWRVIRCKQPVDTDRVMRACAYYLAQPYKVLPAKRSAKSFAYCSELVRKVYTHCEITNVGIADDYVIAPAHLDRLADGHEQWEDVTEQARPLVEFCRKYPALVNQAAQLFIQGLKLNRQRFEERTKLLAKVQQQAKAGKISKNTVEESIRVIREAESNMNHTFWDVKRT